MKKYLIPALMIAGLATASAVQAQGGRNGHFRGGFPTFESMDTNHDGFVTGDEMSARGMERFAKFDTNGDGLATFDEMVAQATALIRQQIERLDDNGDGMLSAQEMRPPRADEQFAHADTDGDGKLTEAEYNAALPGR